MRTYVRLGLLLAAVLALGVLAGRGQPAYAWSYPAALNSNAGSDSGHDYNPQLTTDGGGHWLAIWDSEENLGGTIGTDPDILVAQSTDNGATWTAPAALNSNAATDSGNDWLPQVAADGEGNWLAVWNSMEDLFDPNLEAFIETDPDILVARSTDNGATWTDPAALNTNAASDTGDDYHPQVTTDGGGNWLAVWQSDENLFDPDLGDYIGTDHDILAARSTDNGATWTDPAALNSSAATDSGMDSYPQLTTDGGGDWVAVWESTTDLGGIGGDADILVARSTDNGATWTDPAALNTNAATDSGPDRAPQVTTSGAGNWLAVWNSTEANIGSGIGDDRDILVSLSTDNGGTWSVPAALNTNAATDSGRFDMWPQVTTDGGGNWVAVWYSDENLGGIIGTDLDILMASSTNNGATWADPAALNTNAGTDLGHDQSPQVATDGGGNWLAVWCSNDSLGGTIGTDGDILYATEFVAPPEPVGGVAELPEVYGSSARSYVALAGLAAAALVALGAGGWYARRRFSRS